MCHDREAEVQEAAGAGQDEEGTEGPSPANSRPRSDQAGPTISPAPIISRTRL